MKTAYLHSIGGASGDMVLGALLDTGLPLDLLLAELGKLPLRPDSPSETSKSALRTGQGFSGYRLTAVRERRDGLPGTRVEVHIEPEADKGHSVHDFLSLVHDSSLPASVKEQASYILRRLGEAEAHVHGPGAEGQPLHELGSLDTLVDVVGAVAGLHLLGVERVYASPLLAGSGTVRSAHGLLPVPAPATAQLIAMARAPVVPPPAQPTGELTTPTGAAIITGLASFEVPTLTVERVGYGLGSRETPERPNALALWLGEETDEGSSLVLLETNIDDSTPEVLGYTQERLLAQGALDAWFTPIQMKKNRPAVLLSVLAPAQLEGPMVEVLLRETSTLGVRVRPIHRHEAVREVVEVETSLGRVPVKVKHLGGQAVSVSPEYEVCRSIALERGLPLQEVYRQVEQEAARQLLP